MHRDPQGKCRACSEAVVVIDQWEGRILAALGYASRAEAPIPLGSSVSDWAAEQVASLRNRRTP